jgi:hypothetical protein
VLLPTFGRPVIATVKDIICSGQLAVGNWQFAVGKSAVGKCYYTIFIFNY